MADPVTLDQAQALRQAFGERLQQDVPLAPYTSARIGGPADYLLAVRSAQELAEAVRLLWDLDIPFLMLGGGTNVLIADAGVRGVVVLNQARSVRFGRDDAGPLVWAESGAVFGSLARRAVERGLGGLEWAAGIPGTVGGAIVGNAGAHGGEVAGVLLVAEILQRDGRVQPWTPERLEYAYRESWLKRHPGQAVVLTGTFRLKESTPQEAKATMAGFVEHRQRTQPPGASWGSMFKNPPGDYAGRLIEAVGLKGFRHGGARISPKHANFFVNEGGATAADVLALLRAAQRRVAETFGVELELEIQLLGDWGSEVEDLI